MNQTEQNIQIQNLSTEEKKKRQRELTERLNAASRAYYQEAREIMSNYEYDALYDELTALERETGTTLAGSPTVHVGYEVLSELPKERHESPMLSLDKTKDREALAAWIGDHRTLLSWKLDGLTIVLTYRDGALFKAVTRGNGEVGEVITNNAKVFKNVPLRIPFRGELVLRGEAVIGYREFERINEEIPEADAKYKNPRNLCSGSVRQLNNEITAKRNVHFFAFALVRAEGVDFENSREKQFLWLKEQGFDVVEYQIVTGATLSGAMDWFAEHIETNEYPSDGLVALYDDIAYGESLGRTAKFPRNSMAFKWADEIRETRLTEIEWSPSRTGLINPVAVFEPVELEGTTVSRASVHNISIMRGLELGVGDTIEVYKANMIIPQIAENKTRSGVRDIPVVCPVCGGATEIRKVNDVESLYCTNPDCQAKKIKSFTLFVSRDALNIEGLSEASLEKFIGRGFIHEFADIFKLDAHRAEIVEMEGFGEKSYENLAASIERARVTTLAKVIYSLGIPNVGLSGAKLICRQFGDEVEAVLAADTEALAAIDGIGAVIAGSFVGYFQDTGKKERFYRLLSELTLIKEETAGEQDLKGKVFVVTGSLNRYANRNELKEEIERRGGKVTGSVTGKTDYLINNDTASGSSKNKKARELGIPVISEEEFMNL
ncbi:NAD-dependent DNA ligase LigA [Anaerosacchariphilus sp. NSJ-68]|uniref:DNA ligase n=2 Tax=Lachnospiraceae TaxID=186803 RepID=A0A923LBN5_9FIRM|nr:MULTISPECIES: NAD-dependent DNA ligase LigA [Lachnospiraceae]MBC5659568.1 NAD-dependent DNA ligase LigA [Anaerosacchariphilus hominis]MBC5697235.1 NAD-dependent DNA ligase LigA [Roseburia difficilis]